MPSLRSTLAGVLLAASAAAPAAGFVHRDQVDDIDFHHALLGLPQHDTSFFHAPRADDPAALLYTLSDAGVLGAVNPATGSIVWRQVLGDDAVRGSSPSSNTAEPVGGEGWVAASAGAAVHAWNSISGRNVWWRDFAGVVADAVVVRTAPAAPDGDADAGSKPVAGPRSDVLAASYEAGVDAGVLGVLVVRRLSGNNGDVLWETRQPVPGASPSVKIGAPPGADKVYVVYTGGAGVSSITLDAATGSVAGVSTVSKAAGTDLQVVGGRVAVWADATHSNLYATVLGVDAVKTFALPKDTTRVLVHKVSNADAAAHPGLPVHFVVQANYAGGHASRIYHANLAKGTVDGHETLPATPGAGAFAVSVDKTAGKILFTHVAGEQATLYDSVQGSMAAWPLPENTSVHASGVATAAVAAKSGGDVAVRLAFLTGDEDWVLVQSASASTEAVVAWSRPEGLSGAVQAVFVDRPAAEQTLVRALEEEESQSPLQAYVHRVRRHVADLEKLPAYLQSVPGKLVRSVVGPSDAETETETETDADPFGFHQLALLATRRGRVYALDAASPGTVKWSVAAVDVGDADWDVKHMHVDDASGLALVVGATAAQSVAIDIQTGTVVPGRAQAVLGLGLGLGLGLSLDADADAETTIASAVQVDSAAGPWLLAVPADGRFAADLGAEKCPTESLVVASGDASVQGVRFVVSDTRCVAETTWTFSPPAGHRVVTVATRPAHDPVASLGRVLGDRRVLYKYLNPNLAAVAALNDATGALLTFLVDTVSGQVLATTAYRGVDGTKPLECLLFENTVACTFFADYTTDDAQAVKGYHLAVSDLYASTEPNSRGVAERQRSPLAPLDAVADAAAVAGAAGDVQALFLPAVVSQTFVVGARLASLAVSQTRQGITVRQLLAYVPHLQGIVGIPRVAGVLDARRPVGRDVTPAEAEEGLSRYLPAIEVDPRWVVSHERAVAGIARIVAAPTHVESTSIVLAFGRVDVFGTRVTPSLAFDLLDKGFGKLQMLGTVVALALGVYVLRPLVAQKQTNLRWKAPQ